MDRILPDLSRRELLMGAAAMTAACSKRTAAQATGPVFSVRDFGAGAGDSTAAIQRAIDEAAARGGGIVEIPGSFQCGIVTISGDGITIRGVNGRLVNGRIVIPQARQRCHIENLTILDRQADSRTYALDVAGRNCTFKNVSLVKDPVAGGYQMYLRQPSANCRFSGLRLKGSNGIMVAGNDHVFDGFELESAMVEGFGGDDAFAIKALGESTTNITIRNGVVRGFYAIASFGSEIGTSQANTDNRVAVRNVAVTDVTADRCSSIAFFKPGALIYDWRDGLIDGVRLERLKLTDERGERFACGIRMIAGRGAIIRNVVGRQIEIRARAMSQGKFPTSAIDLSILAGAEARFEDIDLQMSFTDPFDGAEHGPAAPGYPVDHIVRVEKEGAGGMRRISLDVSGRGSRFGGIYIGAGLDDAVTLRRAQLQRVGLHPPSSLGGGGIWSDSRVTLGDVSVDSPVLPKFAGKALGRN